MTAALNEVFFLEGKCVCMRKYVHHEKGRQEYCTFMDDDFMQLNSCEM